MASKPPNFRSEILTAVAGTLGLCALVLVANQTSTNPLQLRFKRQVLDSAEDSATLWNEYDDIALDDDIFQQEAVDDWTSENSTETNTKWEQLYADLGIDLKSENDVQMKQRRVNWNRLRERAIPGLQDQFLEEYKKRMDSLEFYNDISGIDYGRPDPEMSPNSQEVFKGYGKTAPIIKDFVESFDCKSDGNGLWSDGNSLNLFYMIPQGVPLFSDEDEHITDYRSYWDFLMKFVGSFPTDRRTRYNIRISIGSYGASTTFAPRGYLYRPTTPWDRMRRFHAKPKMNAAKPSLFNAIRNVITAVPRYGVSSPTAGSDCVVIWMFQDIPRDINDFMVPEQFMMIEELQSMCTLIPVIVAPGAKDSEAWKRFVANILPGRRSQYAKDPDYSGAYYVESFAELKDEQLMSHIQKYLCLVKNRATCRITEAAFEIPTSGGSPTEGSLTEAPPGIDRFIADYGDEDAATTETTITGGQAATEPFTEEVTAAPKIPVIDSCCGHDGYQGIPYDSELRTCCESGSVASYEFEGSDPCLDVDEFVFK